MFQLVCLTNFVAFFLKPMTLRKKTLLLVAVVTLCLIAVLHITSTRIILKGFKQVEAQNARDNVQRVVESYNDELTKLNLMNGDWAEWDATHNFMNSYSSSYIEENLNDATLIRGDIDLIAYISNQHKLVYGKIVKPNQLQSSKISEQLETYLTNNHFLNQTDKLRAGIVLIPTGAMMITARNIFNSEGTGLSPGILFMGRYLDIKQLEKQTHFSLSLQRYNVESMPPDFKMASQALA
ncbi:MAG: CHASE4 domain-containing protein, partial [Anaerovoracaceae bacterium]